MGCPGQSAERIKIDRDDATGVIFFRVPDGVSTEDLLRTLSATIPEGSGSRATRVVVDFTAVRSASSGIFDEVSRISGYVERIQDARTGSRWALVAPADVAFGLARMFETMTSDLEVEVMAFRTVEEALAWLAAG